MIFIPSASCDSTNSQSNRSINTSRFAGYKVYCRSSTIGQQVCGGCASGFSIPKPCAANGTVAIRNFNARKIDILGLMHHSTTHRKPLTIDFEVELWGIPVGPEQTIDVSGKPV